MSACSHGPIRACLFRSAAIIGSVCKHFGRPSGQTSEVWLVDLAFPNAEPTLAAPREAGVQYEVEHHPAFRGGPALIIRTNADGAEDFKISWAPLATPSRARRRDVVAHRPGVYVASFMLLMDWLIRLEREDGLPRIVVRHLTSEEEHVIAFAE